MLSRLVNLVIVFLTLAGCIIAGCDRDTGGESGEPEKAENLGDETGRSQPDSLAGAGVAEQTSKQTRADCPELPHTKLASCGEPSFIQRCERGWRDKNSKIDDGCETRCELGDCYSTATTHLLGVRRLVDGQALAHGGHGGLIRVENDRITNISLDVPGRVLKLDFGDGPGFAAVARAGVYRSLDGAHTWQKVIDARDAEQLSVATCEDSTVYAAIDGRLIRSSDNGKRFAGLLDTEMQILDMLCGKADSPWVLATDQLYQLDDDVLSRAAACPGECLGAELDGSGTLHLLGSKGVRTVSADGEQSETIPEVDLLIPGPDGVVFRGSATKHGMKVDIPEKHQVSPTLPVTTVAAIALTPLEYLVVDSSGALLQVGMDVPRVLYDPEEQTVDILKTATRMEPAALDPAQDGRDRQPISRDLGDGVVFARDGESLARTPNNGKTWMAISSPAFEGASPKLIGGPGPALLACGDGALFASRDSGLRWGLVGGGFSECHRMYREGSTIYLQTSDGLLTATEGSP